MKRTVLLGLMLGLLMVSSLTAEAAGVLLKQGMSNENVKQVQTRLKELGYFQEKVTGYYGEVTKKAVENYQRDNNFFVDGIVGPATWSALIGGKITDTANPENESPVFNSVLKQGMSGEEVKKVQTRLKELGYFNEKTTGYFGEVTENAVMAYQRAKGLSADGIVGKGTWSNLFGNTNTVADNKQFAITSRGETSRGSVQRGTALISWNEAKNIFSVGKVATVIDIDTGIKFNIKRSMGTNHADVETLTEEDTIKMKKVFGGGWAWDRRAIILVVDGRQLAASMAGMPHAGLDNAPALQTISSRSGGYGRGQNLDTVKGNGMNGHCDVHFLNSRTHGTNRVDSQHQAAIKKAVQYIENN